MKTLLKRRAELQSAGRWDIDFHLPAEGIKAFPAELLKRVDAVAEITKDKRDPTREPEKAFQYVDISSIDVATGIIANPQDVEGADAPSRARKVVSAFDIVVSTCRPTRGAIAVVPIRLHDQIVSTAFSILRARENVNPFYLQFALRLPSTLEQFRKWSTGSSYPAILDSDVAKTLLPVPDPKTQDVIAEMVVAALLKRAGAIRRANTVWSSALAEITSLLSKREPLVNQSEEQELETDLEVFTIEGVKVAMKELPPITTDRNGTSDLDIQDLLDLLPAADAIPVEAL
jgi:hypothetical protein